MTNSLRLVSDAADLPEYPIDRGTRLDSHHFMPWQRQRWLNSSMRLKSMPECRAYYFDLINVAFDQSPIGTLPDDMEQLAKLALCPENDFRKLCDLEFGPLHLWRPCLSEGEVRLMHPHVLLAVQDAIARKEDNRARNEAGNARQRQRRLRSAVAGFAADLARNDAAILWMDDWLNAESVGYRSALEIERAIRAWNNHAIDLRMKNGVGAR